MRRFQLNIIKMIFWLLMGSSIFFYNLVFNQQFENGIRLLGILIILHSLYYFIVKNRKLITPVDLFLLSSLIIGGVGSIYSSYIDEYIITKGHLKASYIILLIQVSIYHIYGENGSFSNEYRPVKTITTNKKTLYIISLIIILILFLLSQVSFNLNFLMSSGIYIGILFIVFTSIILEKQLRIYHIILLICLFLLYYLFVFQGFGRINLATLALSFLVLLNVKLRSNKLKPIIAISLTPALIFASFIRGGSFTDVTYGIGSIISPFYRFGQIIELIDTNQIEIRLGSTIWAAIVTPIPRVFWDEKPWNFNREITYIFAPQYVEYGHSEASILYAEMIYNFGYLAIPLSIWLFGTTIRWLNNKYIEYVNMEIYSIRKIFIYISLVIFMVGFINLFWGGFSTFMAREGFKLIILSVMYFLLTFFIRRK